MPTSKKVRLFPEQTTEFGFSTSGSERRGGPENDQKKFYQPQEAKSSIINNGLYEDRDKTWVIDTPYDVRDAAVIESSLVICSGSKRGPLLSSTFFTLCR